MGAASARAGPRWGEGVSGTAVHVAARQEQFDGRPCSAAALASHCNYYSFGTLLVLFLVLFGYSLGTLLVLFLVLFWFLTGSYLCCPHACIPQLSSAQTGARGGGGCPVGCSAARPPGWALSRREAAIKHGVSQGSLQRYGKTIKDVQADLREHAINNLTFKTKGNPLYLVRKVFTADERQYFYNYTRQMCEFGMPLDTFAANKLYVSRVHDT